MINIKNNHKQNALKIIQIDDDFVILLDFFDSIFKGNKELASKNIFCIKKMILNG